MKFTGMACFLVSLGTAGAAVAADPFYVGNWIFTTAMVAPWADPHRKADDTERARLMGKAVVFKAREISGPRPFACAKPQYKLTDYGPDMLFQGAFEEMQRADKKANPMAIAASLGFTGSAIKTLETGCEIDVHFVDDTTAEVGLNNYVYTLKKR
jgi:2-hydroxychromene-2-carboxylate isomerase